MSWEKEKLVKLSSSFSGTHFRSQNEILQNCIDGSSGILQRKKISTFYMLDFPFDKPVQILDFLDRLPQSRQHRQWQNRTGGELLTGTTWTLEMRDDIFNSIYIHCMASLICENFCTLCFIVFFSSLCQTLKHSSLLSPNP